MRLHRIPRLIAAMAVFGLTLSPAVASAGSCTFQATPNQGWPGATITFKGFSMAPNTSYQVNYDGNQIRNSTTNGNGAFSFEYTLSGSEDTPGTHNWFVNQSPGCGMDDARDFVVLASEPTTTTTTTTTTTIPVTIPDTTVTTPATTLPGDTTTTAAATTTVAGATTTTVLAGGETTTTVADSDGGGGGIPIWMWGVIALLVAIILLLVGRAMGGRRS